MKKLLSLLLLFLLPLILATCYFPPYREELSLAVGTTKKMEGVAFVGPLERGPWDFRDREITFYPSKDSLIDGTFDFVRGFIVAVDERSAWMLYVDHDNIDDADYYINNEDTFPFDNSDDTQFRYSITSIKDGSETDFQDLLGIALFDPNSDIRDFFLLNQNFQIVSATAPAPIDLSGRIAGDLGLFGPPDTIAIGAGLMQENTPNSDIYSVLCLERSTGLFGEAFYRTDPGIIPPPPDPDLLSLGSFRPTPVFNLPGLSQDITAAFYFCNFWDPDLPSYLSYYDSVRKAYRNFSWDSTYDPPRLRVLADMEHRIDMVLSNNLLFSRDGNTSYVYDSNGEFLNSFVTGGLQLVYEIEIPPGPPRAVFTIPIWAPVDMGDDHWEDRLHFLVYWIPTDQLADL